jgi:ubiquinone/menaquinone biosynthesis C-methylase UbiE
VSGVERRDVSAAEARVASRRWWDADATAYQAEHGAFLGAGFVWCPEGLTEDSAGLLGDVTGRVVLEVGCGGGQCTQWLASVGARVVGLDLSAGMLRQAPAGPQYVQADACALPVASGSVDVACSAFGAVPFVAEPREVMRELFRVLRPGGRWVFSVTHPMRWCFPDDPGPGGLTVSTSYFDRSAYLEVDDDAVPSYVETHRTMGDRIRDLVAAGFTVLDVVEPEWTDASQPWGQWSPLRGGLFPGTAIFVAQR